MKSVQVATDSGRQRVYAENDDRMSESVFGERVEDENGRVLPINPFPQPLFHWHRQHLVFTITHIS